MLLEVGKTYLDQDGREWVCECEKPGHQLYPFWCRDRSGIVNGFTREGRWTIQDGYWYRDLIKEKQMQLEAGKYYKTRDGRKAFVAAVAMPNPFGASSAYTARGYCNSTDTLFSWTVNGCEYSCGRTASGDLVSEWIDSPQEIVVDGVTYVRKAGA